MSKVFLNGVYSVTKYLMSTTTNGKKVLILPRHCIFLRYLGVLE